MRGVAQLASALAWGARGRPFESVHPDRLKSLQINNLQALFFVLNSRVQTFICFVLFSFVRFTRYIHDKIKLTLCLQ